MFDLLAGFHNLRYFLFVSTEPPVTALEQELAVIPVYDAYGREAFVARDEWCSGVLLPHLSEVMGEPENLASALVRAVEDGFFIEVTAAAEHLYRTDPDLARGCSVWGIVLAEQGRLDDAVAVFLDYIAKCGENGVILTNLAKVYSKQGKAGKAGKALWMGLKADPNQDAGLAWFETIHREKGGEGGALKALRKVAKLPGSWLALFGLAKFALSSRMHDEAMGLYVEALKIAPDPVPANAMIQMTGELGLHGHLVEMLDLAEQHFRIEAHGIEVANNILTAMLDLGQVEEARALLEALYMQSRPDWQQSLGFWDAEIAKINVSTKNPVAVSNLNIAMLVISGPVWMQAESPASEIFPVKQDWIQRVAFLGGSVAGKLKNAETTEYQLSDMRGRLSRAIPLFLAEQVNFCSDLSGQAMIAWIVNEEGSFAVTANPWEDDQAADIARGGEFVNDYVITTHMVCEDDPWLVQARLVRTIDSVCLGSFEVEVSGQDPSKGVLKIARRAKELLARTTELELVEPAAGYRLPKGKDFARYLLRLEQMLAVRCVAMHANNGGEIALSDPREILDGNLRQCLAYPESLSLRVLMAHTFLMMKRIFPEILPEFKEKLARFGAEYPLPEPGEGVMDRIFDVVFPE